MPRVYIWVQRVGEGCVAGSAVCGERQGGGRGTAGRRFPIFSVVSKNYPLPCGLRWGVGLLPLGITLLAVGGWVTSGRHDWRLAAGDYGGCCGSCGWNFGMGNMAVGIWWLVGRVIGGNGGGSGR